MRALEISFGGQSPMDRHSIFDLGSPNGSAQQAPFPLPPTPTRADELHFPGDDGGQSLADWARRDLEATLQLLADRAQYITGGSGAAIALRDGENIICRASSGPSAPGVGSYFQASSGLSGESVRTRKTLRCDDTASDPRVNQEGCRALGIASFAVLPLIREGDVIGIFEIFANKPGAFGDRDILALQRMGEMVNTALDQVGYGQPEPDALEVQAIRVHSQAAEDLFEIEPQTSEGTEQPLSAIGRESRPWPDLPDPAKDEPKIEPSLNVEVVKSPANGSGKTLSVRTCAACGFPISEGRTLCLDCEAAAGKNPRPPKAMLDKATPGFLAGLEDQNRPTGVKHWISTHRYLLGMIAVTVSTIVFLLTR
jgi:hypothetical protein